MNVQWKNGELEKFIYSVIPVLLLSWIEQVRVLAMIYLFVGQDSLSKDIKLKEIKEQFLAKDVEDFNQDILYARELKIKDLQKRLLSFPVNSDKRLIIIKDAQDLKQEIKEFLGKYVENPYPQIILVLDITEKYNPRDDFIKKNLKSLKVFRFKENLSTNTFDLARNIEQKKVLLSLETLNHLLKNGEKPERILGGMRYALEYSGSFGLRKKLKLLLDCDIDIKTGRLKPDIALEKIVVNLCCFSDFSR